jgi:hypothetical protein
MSCIKALGAVSSRTLFVLPKACKGHALHDSFNWILEISSKIPKPQNIDNFFTSIQSEYMQMLNDFYALFWISIFQFCQI